MDPTYELLSQWAAGLTTAVAFLKVAKVKVYEPSKIFVGRVSQAMDSVERMNKELGPNGGASIKDQVNRIDRLTARVDARQVALMASLPEPMFWTDANGEFEMANRAMEDLTGFSRAHLMGMEWVSAVHPLDQTRVSKEWIGPDDGAVKQKRAWITNCRILTQSGKILQVHIEAHPVRESFGDHLLVGWHGVVAVEDHT